MIQSKLPIHIPYHALKNQQHLKNFTKGADKILFDDPSIKNIITKLKD